MPPVRIHIKLMSGDLLPLEVTHDINYRDLYRRVYDALPEDIRPRNLWQLTLTRLSVGGQYQEIPDTEDGVDVVEEEVFFAILEARLLKAVLCPMINAFLDLENPNKIEDCLYEMGTLQIVLEENEILYEEHFLYHPATTRYYLMDSVEGKPVEHYPERFFRHHTSGRYYLITDERHSIGHWGDEFFFHFTEQKRSIAIFERVVDKVLSPLEGYFNRTKEHFKETWSMERAGQ